VIEYAAVAKLGIPSAQAHLQAAFPDGVPLRQANMLRNLSLY